MAGMSTGDKQKGRMNRPFAKEGCAFFWVFQVMIAGQALKELGEMATTTLKRLTGVLGDHCASGRFFGACASQNLACSVLRRISSSRGWSISGAGTYAVCSGWPLRGGGC